MIEQATALVILVVSVGVLGFLGGKVYQRAVSPPPNGDIVVQRTDFIGRATILIVMFVASLAIVSYWQSPLQWDFVNRVLEVFDRALFLCLGFLIRDKQDVPMVTGTLVSGLAPVAAPADTHATSGASAG